MSKSSRARYDIAADPDIELVDATLAGDNEAFENLVARHQRSIYVVILRMCNDPDETLDIVQRVFLRAYTKLHTFKRRSTFKTWLYTIAINTCRNELRRRQRWGLMERVEDVDPGTKAGLDERLITGERKQRLAEAVESLPPKQKAILVLRIYEEMSFRDIAGVVGGSENAAKVNFHFAVKSLQEKLKEH